METDELTQAGYRATFEYYDKLEIHYRRLAEEMFQKKIEALTQLKKLAKEYDNL